MREFKKVHKRDIIRAVRNAWMKQYKDYPDGKVVGWVQDGRTAGDVRKALASLDLESCSSADVDGAIGTTGWARNECDQCDGDFDTVLQLGDSPDYDARWWNMCAGCLVQATLVLPQTPLPDHQSAIASHENGSSPQI